MKPVRPLRLLLPAAAFLAVGTCLAPLSVQASPGHSAVDANYRSSARLPLTASDGALNADAVVSDRPYDAFGFATDGALYQPVGDLDAWINRASRYYNRYRQQQRSHSQRRFDPDDRNSPYYRGYHPNDPDDRNNPNHPDYIGPPGSYPRGSYRYRSYPNRYQGYYPNDPDDRNNPNHPDYIGPPRWRGR